MFELKMSAQKNTILSVLRGRLDTAEAEQYTERYKKCIDAMEANFILVIDLTGFIPTSDEVRDILHRGTEYAVQHGLARVVRIVSDCLNSAVGNIQLNRTSRELGYQVDVVESKEEAERLLGWEWS